jgi:hypothetical protein
MSFKTKKNNQTIKCKACGTPIEGVGADAVTVTCWKCVNLSMSKAHACADDEDEPAPKK